MTKHEAILEDVETAMKTVTGMSGTGDNKRVFRSMTMALQRSKHPFIAVEPISAQPVRGAVGRFDWSFTFQVALVVRADVPDQNGDSLMNEIYTKVMALQAGLVDLIPTNVDWEFQNADKPLGATVMQFKCLYQTAENDLSST